jgi:DnaJ-domain-containing protein 1
LDRWDKFTITELEVIAQALGYSESSETVIKLEEELEKAIESKKTNIQYEKATVKREYFPDR